MQQNEMTDLTNRTERLVDAISGAILSTVEVAAERIALASEVARVQQRMSAFGSVLEAIGAQKQALIERMDSSAGAMKKLLLQQVEVLTMQEVAVLSRAGVQQEVATQAVKETDKPLYVRNGKRFVPLGANGE